MTKKHEMYVERREQGDYAVRRPGASRASTVEPTQAKAITWATEHGAKHPLVERVRHTSVGKPDKWRSSGK